MSAPLTPDDIAFARSLGDKHVIAAVPRLAQVGLPGVVTRRDVVACHSSRPLVRYGVGMNSTDGRRWLRRG